MQICKNCHRQNEDGTDTCVHCHMKGQLVPFEEKVTRTDKNVKNLYRTCQNCGTVEPGNGEKCAKCHFPLSQVKSGQEKEDPGMGMISQKQNERK